MSVKGHGSRLSWIDYKILNILWLNTSTIELLKNIPSPGIYFRLLSRKSFRKDQISLPETLKVKNEIIFDF